MRRRTAFVSLAAYLVFAIFLAGSEQLSVPPSAEAQDRPPGCENTYTQRHLRRGAKSVFRSPDKITGFKLRRLRKYIRCARRSASKSIMHGVVRKWKLWRSSYGGHWRLASERLSSATHTTLARLRGCETRGIEKRYGPGADYRYDGHHDGAYQYTVSTWERAQRWIGTTGRLWRSKAFQASKDHQDAVTGQFFFAHRGEWACKA